MNISTDSILLIKELLEIIPCKELANICYKKGKKEGDKRSSILDEIFKGHFKDRIKDGVNENNKENLMNILCKIFVSYYPPNEVTWQYFTLLHFDNILDTFSNMLKIYLNGWSYHELANHFGPTTSVADAYQFEDKLKQYFHDNTEFINMVDILTKKSMNHKDILNFLSTKFKENIVVYDGSFSCQMYHNNNNHSPLVLYKHDNGLYATIPGIGIIGIIMTNILLDMSFS